MIFCVEDEYNIRELITYSMQAIGFEACGLADGKELFQALEKNVFPKLILLDIMLPDLDGLEILTKLKDNPKTKHIPIILLTAKGAECDKVKGLDLGADDYITKPFSIMELVARVKAVLRRAGQKEREHVLSFGDIVLDLEKHEARSSGELVVLTSKEFELLKKLMSNPECVISRNTLLEEVWGVNFYGETRTVDAHIKTLRQKLGENGNKIETIRGIGYKISK